MRKSFITYFEPFGGRSINASKEIVTSLTTNFEVVGLPVSWKRTLPIISKMLNEDPEYIFLVGEAGNYQNVTVELVARNICSGMDEDGVKKDKDHILRATPKEIPTNFNVEGLKCITSTNAGRFLCNYVYYICLLRTEVTKIIFIHVPYLHPKGSRKKENVMKKVENAIYSLMENDNDYLIKLNRKPFKLTEENAYDVYEDIQKEYALPNIIIGINREEDGSFVMTGRADGYKGIWYEYGQGKAEELKARKTIYYKIARFQYGLTEEDREQTSLLVTKTLSFSEKEYEGSEKLFRRYINLFISRVDYADEMAFYVSLDRIEENLLKSVLDRAEENALRSAKQYVSRLGPEKSKKILRQELEK